MRPSSHYRIAVAAVLVVHAGLLAWGATRHSPTNDEVGHLAAGVAHWQFGRFELYRVNPPLVRMLAAIPVVLDNPATDWRNYDFALRTEWTVGLDFMAANGDRSLWHFAAARMACIPLSLLGALVCARWAADLYGPRAGLAAAVVWCFCPNVLANGMMMTPDAGATALGVAAGYAFWRWLRSPTWTATLVAGLVLGAAELAKTTWIVLFPLWPALWLVYRWPALRVAAWPARRAEAVRLAVILGLAIVVINAGYGFDGTCEPLGSYQFVSSALGGVESAQTGPLHAHRGNRFAGTWLGTVPVPVPHEYLFGIDVQRLDFEQKMWSYLRGEWKLGGWWYYYLYALAVKLPLGTLGLLALALTCRGPNWRDEVVLLAPAVVVVTLVSSQTGLNHHLRYILPAFPFAFVWACRVFQPTAGRWRAVIGAGLIAWAVVSSLAVYPHNLSYFNEAAGGPRNGHRHLLHSNIDWGQDLLYLKAWYDAHPAARPLGTAVDSFLTPKAVGIDSRTIAREARPGADPDEPFGLWPGWYAVSVGQLRHRDGRYLPFLRYEPVATAGYSIYIYRITADDANRVRRELGRPPLPPNLTDPPPAD